jgi:peptide/nickel transport system permease protein
MAKYILRRLLYMIPVMFIISLVIFITIHLPPGDPITKMIENQRAQQGRVFSQQDIDMMEARYGYGDPLPVQYVKWIGNIILHGDFGYAVTQHEEAGKVIAALMPLTILISLASFFFTWAIAIPIGIFSAVRQYSLADYIFTFIGFIGLAIPNFLLALVLLVLGLTTFHASFTGLFSSAEIQQSAWSLAKVLDLLKHIWVPMVVIGMGGTAGLIRIMRANLLDELHKPYVETARAKGLSETQLLIKYPLRHAMNPFVSGFASLLPSLVAGEAIAAIVLNLPTEGPVLLNALQNLDVFLAGGFLLFLSLLTLVSTLMSDILLAWLDPRIRYGN